MMFVCKINRDRRQFQESTYNLEAGADEDIGAIAERASIINLNALKMDPDAWIGRNLSHDMVEVFYKDELLGEFMVDLMAISKWAALAERI